MTDDLRVPSAVPRTREEQRRDDILRPAPGLADLRQSQRDQKVAAEEERDRYGALDLIGAYQVRGGIGFIDRAIRDLQHRHRAYTEGTEGVLQSTEEFIKDMEESGIERSQWSLFDRAIDDEHYQYLKTVALQNQDAAHVSSQFGLAANILAGGTDPVAFGLDILSGGLAMSARAGRLANAVRSGLAAGGTNAALTGMEAQYNPDVDLADLAMATGAGLVLGGALGAHRGSEVLDARKVREEALRDYTDSYENLGAARLKGLPESKTPGLSERTVNDAVQEQIDRGVDNIAHLPAFHRIRRSLSARMGSLKNAPTARHVSRWLFRDGVGAQDRDAAVQFSAGEVAARNRATLDSHLWRAWGAAWRAEKEARGLRGFARAEELEWSRQVADGLRGVPQESATVNQAVKELRQVLDKAYDIAVDAGIMPEGARIRDYFPQIQSKAAYQRIFSNDPNGPGLTEPQAIDIFKQSILSQMRREGGDVDEDLAEAYAKAIINRGKGQVQNHHDGMVRPLSTENLEELRQLLLDAGTDAERTAHILGRYTAKVGDESKPSFAHQRIRLDPNFRTTVVNRYGKEVEIGVTDFMENDAAQVVARATREMAGWSAIAKQGGIRNPAELNALRNHLADEARLAGNNPDTTLRMFDIGVNSVLGRSTEMNPNSVWAKVGRFVRDTQFARVMNQVGFTQLSEIGPLIAHAGVGNVFRSLPELPAMLKRGADGELKGTSKYLEDWLGLGTEHLRNQPFLRTDGDAFVDPLFGDSSFGRFMENSTNVATRFTSMVSGMAPINAALQRLAGRAVLLKTLQLAKQGRPLSKGMQRRLRSNGLDEKTQEQLFEHLRKFKSVDDIVEADLPLELRETFGQYLFRVTRQQILEGDASDSVMLMHGTAGKIIMQFRSFMAYSYERHFLNSIYHWRDWNTYMLVMLSSTIAGLQWMARTSLNYADDEEKRRELLTKENFVKNAVGMSSWGAMIPTLVDSAAWAMDAEPQFAHSRASGLSSNFIAGIPAVDHLNTIGQAAGIVPRALRTDRDVETRDLENLSKIFWFQNLMGWRNLQNAAIREAEERDIVTEKSKKNREARKETREARERSWRSEYLFDLNPGDR